MSVTSEDISRVLKAVPTELLIGGNWVAGEDTLDVEDPSTGDVLISVADASPNRASLPWTPPSQRPTAGRRPIPATEGKSSAGVHLDHRTGRRHRPTDDAGDGQTVKRISGRSDLRR